MKKYKWILSGMVALAVVIYACTPVVLDEKILASVDKMPSDMSIGWELEEHRLEGYSDIFTFVSDADWCVVSGDKIRIETNQSSQSREASISVSWKNETMKIIRVQQSETGYINGLPETLDFNGESGSKNVELTSNASWTVSSDQSWCSVSPASGNSNASVRVSVTKNTTSSTRTARITFKYGANAKVIIVKQEKIKILEIDFFWATMEDGAFSFTINVTSNLSWTVTSPQTWFTFNPKSGSGNGSVTVNVGENTSPTRVASITFTGDGIEVVTGFEQWGPPLNNQCSGAITLSCGASMDGETKGATFKNISYNNVSKYGVWYTFTGDGRQTTISLSPEMWGFNEPKIVIFRGSCSSMTYVGESGRTNRYTFRSTSGTRYYIYVAHYNPLGNYYYMEAFKISRTCESY